MIDPELNKQLNEINLGIERVSHKIGGSWYAFFRGLLTGFGYVLGAFAAVLLIGWMLNVIGIIPAFKKYADQWRGVLQQQPIDRQIPASSK